MPVFLVYCGKPLWIGISDKYCHDNCEIIGLLCNQHFLVTVVFTWLVITGKSHAKTCLDFGCLYLLNTHVEITGKDTNQLRWHRRTIYRLIEDDPLVFLDFDLSELRNLVQQWVFPSVYCSNAQNSNVGMPQGCQTSPVKWPNSLKSWQLS